ncbi:transglycosylase domain-containing protein [Deinococcus ficus]|uniref:transglycosylase domain-containing protein n=1 Tax=Deinococcus ficus TaxID=317577 RepID=UPI00174D1703|nr:penicillin-binding protein [Deinococcus ficus]
MTPASGRPAAKSTPQTRPAARAPEPGRGGCLAWFFRLLGWALFLAVLGVAGLWVMWGRDLPRASDLDVLEFSGQTRVYDRTGALVGTLTPSLSSGGSANLNLLKLGQISPWLQKAVVTSEDRRFFAHHGVDYIGIARGVLKGLLKNDLEGGSSITQQVVKNTLLADLEGARTPERKFKEAVLAYQVDRSFDKTKILNAYLNVIYWGDGGRSDIVGAGTAAHAYFAKNASELNLAESVYLATIIPAPNRRYKDFKAYRPLMRSLLDRMVEDGQVTKAEADAAWRTPIYPAGWRLGWNTDGTLRSAALENPGRIQSNIRLMESGMRERYLYRHYLQAVEKELLPLVGRKALYAGGKIYTGMNVQAQQAAEQASLDARNLPDGATLGIALVSPKDGEVLALVGQKLTGERPSDWNNAVQAKRQVGSSIKPLLYALALEKGWKQSDTILDAPITGTDYQPKNYDGRWTGRFVTMRYSLDHSLNLPTVRIAQELGVPVFEDKLRDLGFDVPRNLGLSLSIGTLEASPLQMAAAYATFVNGGLYHQPTLVRRFDNAKGETVYKRAAPEPRRVWDAQTAWLGLDMLRGVVNDLSEAQGGLATRARIPGWEVGGKTGTTNDIKDLWFAGVTPTMAGAVWVGKQEGGVMPAWAYSGTVPTPIWQAAMAGALSGVTPTRFVEPDSITYRVVRQVSMAFRTAEADQGPVQHDGRTRREQARTPAPAPQPDPEPEVIREPEPAVIAEPTPEVSEIPALPPEEVPTEPVTPEPVPAPDPAAPAEIAPPQPLPTPEPVPEPEFVPEDETTGDVTFTPEDPGLDSLPPLDEAAPGQ